ncbi:MAG TPA: exodeoxyribonuclease VII large subunit [Candidatus Baltobacteraceae bacterium]|jgi:exodeoxyribonuclease VII large subunit|nr:exodeoxyribonuclease VII large subunit [Candidatus Baltobacteraceae bacterium]
MAAEATSQWDFAGELFPREVVRRVFSVSELTADIRHLLERHLGQVWISGEITNCRAQNSGHIYFTLKDAFAQISCVVFRNDPVAGRESLQDGRKVILKGELTVYEPRGQYQLHVLAVEPQGIGALQAAFEKLKQKLAAEGLFAQERKRPIPPFPRRIGLVTSQTGAAIHDVLHVVQRRNRTLQIILVPCAVQGTAAPGEISSAITLLNQWSRTPGAGLDAILLTRGGGSLEDLWAFNEEAVARAIFISDVPVVSAVGHETDFTISDFVADLRAATPSAAAEILTEGVFSSSKWMAQARQQMDEAVGRRLFAERRHFAQLSQRLAAAHPRRELNRRLQRLDDLQESLARCPRLRLQHLAIASEALRQRLRQLRPSQVLRRRRELLDQRRQRLREQAGHLLQRLRQHCDALNSRLRLLGPEQVLARGYSITLDAVTGAVIRAAQDTRPGQELKTKLRAGEVRSIVARQGAGSPRQ